MPLIITNFILFQVGWFACIWGARLDIAWLGPIIVLAILIFHLSMAINPLKEMQLIFLTLLVGGLWDSFMVISGWLVYDTGMFSNHFAPYWILSMWVLFATTFNVSLRWMKQRLILAALLGGTAGPLAYYAGSQLGAATMPDVLITSLVIALGWSLLMPLLMWLSNRFDGFHEPVSSDA